MNTLIKGTFPVRFRRDGKDGVNVWLKYASVLDLTDSNTGKSYPSKIFNEPTAECKFIGIPNSSFCANPASISWLLM